MRKMPDARNSMRPVFIALVVGAVVLVVTEIGLIFMIRRLGLAWRGEIFSNEPLNWKDSIIWFLSYAGFLAGFLSTMAYVNRRLRVRERRKEEYLK